MQFVPANKLSSHREKAGCPLVAKSSSDGEFSSGEKNRSRADNHFLCSNLFLRVRNEERGNYFKGWSWTIEIRFFLFSSFAASVVRHKTKFMQLYRFGSWKRSTETALDQTRTVVVWCHVSYIRPIRRRQKEWVCLCMHENTYQNRRRQKQRYK